jgi:hypothetical protein
MVTGRAAESHLSRGREAHNEAVSQARRIAGIGAVVFVVALLVGFTLYGPKSGAYSPAETAAFVDQGSTGLILSIYLFALSIIGLIVLMAYLSAHSCGGGRRDRIVWGTSIAAAASFLIGWGLYLVPSSAHVAGGPPIDPAVSYAFISGGFVVLFGVGDLLLGIALLTLAIRGLVLPAWVRAFTALTGLSALSAWGILLATGWSPNQWLAPPFYLVILWGLAIGVWLMISAAGPEVSRP